MRRIEPAIKQGTQDYPSEAAALKDSLSARRPQGRPDGRCVCLVRPGSFEAAEYRSLCHKLESRKSEGLKVIGVTSPDPGDGKTTTAINLAACFAELRGSRTLLVDADLRRSAVASALGMKGEATPGLADLLTGFEFPLENVVRPTIKDGLSFLPAGSVPRDPYRVLRTSVRVDTFAEQVRGWDWVIVDTAPLLAVPDWRAVSSWIDGFLVVIGARRTPRSAVAETLDAIGPERTIGIVLNRYEVPRSRQKKYYHYYITPQEAGADT